MSAVKFLQQQEIERSKWDACVGQSTHSLPYALTWYLDAVAENWAALVLNDYEAVMPLVWLRKWGVKCLYQPYYCQQLGVFSKRELAPKELNEFLHYVSTGYPYSQINLNPTAQPIAKELNLKSKKNLLLSLDKEYPTLRQQYSDNHKRNIKKAEKAAFVFERTEDVDAFRKFYISNIRPEKEIFKQKHKKILVTLTDRLMAQNLALLYRVVDENEKWMAASLIIKHGERWINLINTSSLSGKQKGASHFLFDNILRKNCGQTIVFDFEGSSIPSIARFYEGFGAREEVFYLFEHTLASQLKQRFL